MQEGKPLRKLVLDHSVFGLALQGERLYTTSLDNNNLVHIPADTRSAFPVISVQSPVSIQCCWQS